MKHFVFHMTDFSGGGAESVFTRVANSLLKRGHEVSIIIKINNGELRDTLDRKVNIIELTSGNILSDIWFIRSYLKKTNFNRFYTTLDRPNLVGFLASTLAGVRQKHFARIAAVHSEHLFQSKIFKRRLLLHVLGIFYPVFGNFVCISDAVQMDLEKKYRVAQRKITKIYNPIKPIDDVTPSVVLKSERSPFRILVVGRLVKQKNVDKIINVFVRFRNIEPNSELIILGDGEDRKYLECLAIDNKVDGNVKFLGFVKNTSYYFKNSNVFILFSSWEGLPNVVLDALQFNLQIIVSDAPGGSQELIGNGRFGYVVRKDDEFALLKAIETAKSNPMKINQLEKKNFLCKFDLDKITDQYEGNFE
jgi:glycosyltransferase involved in cell wall biosynthesis